MDVIMIATWHSFASKYLFQKKSDHFKKEVVFTQESSVVFGFVACFNSFYIAVFDMQHICKGHHKTECFAACHFLECGFTAFYTTTLSHSELYTNDM